MSQVHCFINGFVLHEHGIVKVPLFTFDGKIVPPQKEYLVHDLKGKIICPGLIDIQVNGGWGVDFTHTPEKWQIVAEKLLSCGVTTFLATLISPEITSWKRFLPFCKETGNFLGLHFEGPLLNPKYLGAHCARDFGNSTLWDEICTFLPLRMVTCAPELPEAFSFIKQLTKRGIIVSLGHMDADAKILQEAKEKGAKAVTHLFNAMRSFNHRENSLVSYVLREKKFFYSIIADGTHLSSETLLLCLKANFEKLILISDMSSLVGGMEKGFLSTQAIERSGKACCLSGTHKLAGSLNTLWEDIVFLSTTCEIPLHRAVLLATQHPAKLLKLKNKGSLKCGADADFFIFDPKTHDVLETYVRGSLVWAR